MKWFRWAKTWRLRARCTNVVQLWTQVKSEFEPSSAVNCVAPKWFKRWSPFTFELPSDHRSNFDLSSTCGYACTLGNKYFPSYYRCKKIVRFKSYPVQKTSSYRVIRLLMQLYWWSGYVKFLLLSFYVLFMLDKLTNRWINCIFGGNVSLLQQTYKRILTTATTTHSYQFIRHPI